MATQDQLSQWPDSRPAGGAVQDAVQDAAIKKLLADVWIRFAQIMPINNRK